MTSQTNRKTSRRGHTVVESLPRFPKQGVSYWIETPNGKREFTHSLFKFPAKFHPPIVRWAINSFYEGGKILDPFMGSGTVQVEALAKGISSFGIDVDPLATFISAVKSTPIDPISLKKEFLLLKETLSSKVNIHSLQVQTAGGDIGVQEYESSMKGLPIPPMPNISHWFRLYVIIDLARILQAIESVEIRNKSRNFFKACLTAIIRRVSNAEPGTVSGLEVTSIQAELNKTRKISVFKAFFTKVEQEIQNMSELWDAYQSIPHDVSVKILAGDTTSILKKKKTIFDDVSLVITSPPYCRAVEYSRRHYLEMYWLGLVDSQSEHISLTHSYIGRKLVRLSDWDEKILFEIPQLDKTIRKVEKADGVKGRTVRHYFYSMDKFFESLADAIPSKANVICVVGNSVCCKIPINTSSFIAELAGQYLQLKKQFSYAIRNHHMQYGLWNGDGIKEEHVLILRKK
jgi:16S rRNA G966 N2-methylase RsmD